LEVSIITEAVKVFANCVVNKLVLFLLKEEELKELTI